MTLGSGDRVTRVAVRNEDLRMFERRRRDADPLVRTTRTFVEFPGGKVEDEEGLYGAFTEP